ncbi:MAG: dipeptide epimerase [Ignavibacteriales bacterium]|nr:dipeptide epimerase [Ignavibacteriales bacterium]
MGLTRRDLLKAGTLLTGGLLFGGRSYGMNLLKSQGGKMELKFYPYTLELRHVFTIASGSRKTTPVVLTEINYEGYTGYGEASMPPYLGESHESVMSFLSKVELGRFSDPFDIENILDYIDDIAPGNKAAKASVDIALHDLTGKIMGQPWYKIWGYDKTKTPYTSFTIGIDTPEIVRQKVKEAEQYKVLKVKMGLDNDKEMVETIRSVSQTPLTVDVNQGWKDKNHALEMVHWLNERKTLFVEQPMPKDQIDDIAWLTENSPLPIVGDESVQRLEDVIKAHGIYSGINIKYMKCTGMREGHKMLNLAKALNMKVMLGCMTETSCAISAAAQLSPMVDWADLDGNLLISNDIFDGVKVVDGKIQLTDLPGIGIKKL